MSQALLGIPLLLFLAWLTSSERHCFPWKTVASAMGLQLVLALLLVNRAVLAIEEATRQGTAMVFGYLGGGPAPFEVTAPEHLFVLAFRALTLLLVFAPLCALLWHWRIVPALVGLFARLLRRVMGLSGAVSMGAASSIFIGMTETPLLIKPYLRAMPNSELFILMTCGMATVAGTVMGLYAAILSPVLPQALSHILVASLISVPAAIAVASIMLPPDRAQDTAIARVTSPYHSSVDALVTGVAEGLKLLASIVGMLIAFVALVHLVNLLLGLIPTGGEPLTLTGLLGQLLAPLAWLLGSPWDEASTAGELLATKVVINELVAYLQLAALEPDELTEHSRIILTYALCGFANFGSLGILLGGMTALCPERREDILMLAPRTLWSGFLATCLTGALIGLVY